MGAQRSESDESAVVAEEEGREEEKEEEGKTQSVIFVCASPLLPFNSRSSSSTGGEDLEDEVDALLTWSYRHSGRGAAGRTFAAAVSEIDAKRLLRTLAKWQQEGEDRAVLLVSHSDCSFSVEGVAHPFAVNSDGEELLTEEQLDLPENIGNNIWSRTRSRFTQILLGKLSQGVGGGGGGPRSLLQSGPRRLSRKFDRLGFRCEFDLDRVCVRRGFWEVVFQPLVYAVHAAGDGIVPETPAAFRGSCVTDLEECGGSAEVVVGPLVSLVTTSSAVVLLETAHSGHVELLCVDQLTGAEFISTQWVAARRPRVFFFEGLQPNRPYDVVIAEPTQFDKKSSFSSTAAFTTHRRTTFAYGKSDEEEEEENEEEVAAVELQSVEALRRLAYSQPDAKGPLSVGSASRSATLSLTKVAASPAAEEEEEGSLSSSVRRTATRRRRRPGPFRIVGVGANRPSHRSPLSAEERGQLLAGVQLCKQVGSCAAQSWTEVDIVVHCGEPVDLGPVLDQVVTYLTRAEGLQKSSRHDEVEGLISAAEECVRDAFRFHWGNGATGELLRRGSHYFVSSPSLLLLSAFHLTTLAQLERELSPFCCERLESVLAAVHSEYVHLAHSRSMLTFFAGGRVVFFELVPDVSLRRRSGQVALIDDAQLYALNKLLMHPYAHWSERRGGGGGGGRQQEGEEEREEVSRFALVLLSPIPILLDDELHDEFSSLSDEQRGVRYGQSETALLLDLLASWLEASPSCREVIILTGYPAPLLPYSMVIPFIFLRRHKCPLLHRDNC